MAESGVSPRDSVFRKVYEIPRGEPSLHAEGIGVISIPGDPPTPPSCVTAAVGATMPILRDILESGRRIGFSPCCELFTRIAQGHPPGSCEFLPRALATYSGCESEESSRPTCPAGPNELFSEALR